MDRKTLLEALGLALVLAFVVGLAYLPHADSARQPPPNAPPEIVRLGLVYWDLATGAAKDYPFPVHVDEDLHWARMASIERAEGVRANGIYDVVPTQGSTFELRGIVHERGFFVALVHFQELTGIEWIDIIHFLPALWAGVTAFLVWAALRPWPGALGAAALIGLVPTSARFLGPGFLVPIGFGLAWIAAAFVLLPYVRRVRGAATLLVMVTVWAFFIHLIAGFAVLLLLLVSIPLQGRNFRSFALLALTAALPLFVLLDAFSAGVREELGRVSFLPIDLTVFDQLGRPFLIVWAVGVGLILTRKREPGAVSNVLYAATIASVVTFSFLLIAIGTRGQQYALYDRWHQPFAVFATVPVAAALVYLARSARDVLSRTRGAPRGAALPGGLAIAVMLVIATPAVGAHIREPYYHIIEKQDWDGFLWARDHVNDTYRVFLTDPWKAPIFHALTGKTPYVFLSPGAPVLHEDDWIAYQTGAGQNGAWLAERNITLVFDAAHDPSGFERTSEYTVQMPAGDATQLDRILADQSLKTPLP